MEYRIAAGDIATILHEGRSFMVDCVVDDVHCKLELPKYEVPGDNELSGLPGLERWFCFLQEAGERDVRELAKLLGDPIFAEAAGVLEKISQSPEDRQF